MPMDQSWMKLLGALVVVLPLSCGGDGDPRDPLAAAESELTDRRGRFAASVLAEVDLPFPAGIAAGRDVFFVGSPFEGRVIALSRADGAMLGELPPPPNGFILPFIMKSVSGSRVAVLDAGGFPSPDPFVPANPTIYEYEYRFGPHSEFRARLVRSIPFDGAVIGFAEDAIRLDDGRYLLSDAVLGSIWIAERDGTIRPGIVPETLSPEDAIPEMVFCDTMPVVEVGGVPFLFTDSAIPGVTALAERNGKVYFSGSCAGAVYSFPLSILDDSRAPHERAEDIRPVSIKPHDVVVEELLGLTFNPFDRHDPYLYAADALQLRVIRIDPRNGRRSVVGDDPVLFNFPSSLAFAPPRECDKNTSTLFVLSNQQHLTPLLNDAIQVDMLEPPFLATQIQFRGH